MEKTFNPKLYEDSIYTLWQDKGYFTTVKDKNKKPFTIVMPPPNITGQLHMGHALNNSLQDMIIRFKRMQGYCALWLPGTDHASIATELKVVEHLKEQGIDKKDLSREKFLEYCWQWKKQYGGRIKEQLKKLGSSCDWSREAFTMDDNLSAAVKDSFVKYHRDGLIYRGNRIINWCTSCKTALSDAEVEHEERPSHLWHIKYPLFSDSSQGIVVATTRPETMLGDVAVAVNPEDKRYAAFIGKMLVLPNTNRQIPVISDTYVEKDFGSGAVKITPAHDPNDFEVASRHDLPAIQVIGEDGIMTGEEAGSYVGLDRFEARKKLVKDLEAAGYLVKVEPHTNSVGHCHRCASVIEPLISQQWFVKMKPLAGPAIKVVEDKIIKYIPKRYEKMYLNWMRNIRDWCISRQLIWGHRIPAYYCDCGAIMVDYEMPKACDVCGSGSLRQDEDVLDTWFSSALWSFSTLGYPNKCEDLEYFHPTNVLVTAYDIISFWVSRMIFSAQYFMKEIPFSEVLIHGVVRDDKGRKMSKSLGNGIDPLEIIQNYGADALRFSLSHGIAPGADTRFSTEKIESARNFMNKIWNASRFVIMGSKDIDIPEPFTFDLSDADKWILTKLNKTIRAATKALERYDVGLAAAALYEFLWNDFCDWYIELSKPSLYEGNAVDTEQSSKNQKVSKGKGEYSQKQKALSMLNFVLATGLKLLHPFVPFITEEIYSNLPLAVKANESIMIEKWPEPIKFAAPKKGEDFEVIMNIIKGIRNVRAEMGVAQSKKVKLFIHVTGEGSKSEGENAGDKSQSSGKNQNTLIQEFIQKNVQYIKRLAGAEEIVFISSQDEVKEKTAAVVFGFFEVLVPLGDLIDLEKEIQRLEKEIQTVIKEIARGEGMLSNQRYLEKAPKELVQSERVKLEQNKEFKAKLEERVKYLGNE